MTEKANEKVEKAQYEGIIHNDKVMIYNRDAIEELQHAIS